MSINFNFIQTTPSGLDFNFGPTGSSPYYSLNFIDSPYTSSYNFNFGASKNIYTILKGTSNSFTSVWVLNSKMYVSTNDTLTVVDLSNNSIHDYYTQTHVGRSNESLEHDSVIDINVV